MAIAAKSIWSISLLFKARCKDHSAKDILKDILLLQPLSSVLLKPPNVTPAVKDADFLINSLRFKLKFSYSDITIPNFTMISLKTYMPL